MAGLIRARSGLCTRLEGRLLKPPVDTKRDIEAAPVLADDDQPRERKSGRRFEFEALVAAGRGLKQQLEGRIATSQCIAGLAPIVYVTALM